MVGEVRIEVSDQTASLKDQSYIWQKHATYLCEKVPQKNREILVRLEPASEPESGDKRKPWDGTENIIPSHLILSPVVCWFRWLMFCHQNMNIWSDLLWSIRNWYELTRLYKEPHRKRKSRLLTNKSRWTSPRDKSCPHHPDSDPSSVKRI